MAKATSCSPPTDTGATSAPIHHGPNEPGSIARGVGGNEPMEHIGAGIAAPGVFGPGIGIGILAGLSAQAIGRNPDAAGQIRGIAIILAAFAEGLGVLAIVVGLLAIFIKGSSNRTGDQTVELLAVVSAMGGHAVQLGAEESGPLFQINLFQVIV